MGMGVDHLDAGCIDQRWMGWQKNAGLGGRPSRLLRVLRFGHGGGFPICRKEAREDESGGGKEQRRKRALKHGGSQGV